MAAHTHLPSQGRRAHYSIFEWPHLTLVKTTLSEDAFTRTQRFSHAKMD